MIATLLQVDAWAGSTPVALRFASHDDERLCHLDDRVWWPAIAQLPTLRRDLFDGAFDAASISSPSGDLTVCIDAVPGLPALALHDTRARIWRGMLGAPFAAFELVFDGRVKEQPAVADGMARLSIAVDDSWLDEPLLATYAGTGAAEGPADLQGQVKPLALGAPRFASAVLVDAVDNIYQLSAYGPIQAVETAFERLNRFGASYGDGSSFAALKAADIPAGRWGTCLAGGYVRLGAPADGMLSFHMQGDTVGGWSRLSGDLIARVATIAGGAGKFATVDVAALNIARPWPLSIMVTDQTTARDLIQRIAASVNAVAYVDWLGILRVAPVGIGAPTLTMAADGSALPPVASVGQIAVAAPYWKLAQGAATTWQVHALGDIAFNAPLNPRGPYDDAETYREGDMVTLPTGSQWLFVGVTPLSGSNPTDTNINWFRLSDDITAGNVKYADGTPLEALKPATPGATAGAPAGTMVGNKSVEALLAGLSGAQQMAAVGEYFARRMETVDPASGLVAITEYANADGVVVARTMGAGPAGGFIGYMASEYLFTDNTGGNIRPIMQYSHDVGEWQMLAVRTNRLMAGTGNSAQFASADASAPVAGAGMGTVITVLTKTVELLAEGAIQALAPLAMSYAGAVANMNLTLWIGGVQVFSVGGGTTEISATLAGSRGGLAAGVYTIEIKFEGPSNMTVNQRHIASTIIYT